MAFWQLQWATFACSVFFCFGLTSLFLVIPEVNTFMDMVREKVVYGDLWCSYRQELDSLSSDLIHAHRDISKLLVAPPSNWDSRLWGKTFFANTFYPEILHAISNNSKETVDDLILCEWSKDSHTSKTRIQLRERLQLLCRPRILLYIKHYN